MAIQEDKKNRAVVRASKGTEDESEVDYVVTPPEESGSLREQVNVVRQNFLLVLVAGAIATGWQFHQQRQTVPMYVSGGTIRFTDMRSNLTSGVGSAVATQSNWVVDPIKSELELLKSDETAGEAVVRGKLQIQEVSPAGSAEWLASVNATGVEQTDTLRLVFGDAIVSATLGKAKAQAAYGQPLRVGPLSFIVPVRPASAAATLVVFPKNQITPRVRAGISAVRRMDTDVADISFADGDANFAPRALNAIALAFQALNIRSSQEAARARRQFIDEQLRQADSVLELQRAQLSTFRTSEAAFGSKDQLVSEQAGLASIRMRREELNSDKQVYTTLLERARGSQRSGNLDAMKSLISAPGIAGNPAIAQTYGQFVGLRSTLDSLTTGPFPSAATNPDVQRVNLLMRSASDRLIGEVESMLETVDARIAALDGLISNGAGKLTALPKTAAEEARLLQQAETTQRMADQLREEQQKARISEVAQVGQVQIIDRAIGPGYVMNTPQRSKTLTAGLFGLAFGVLLVLLLDRMDTSIRRLTDVERILQLPTLGAVPELSGVKPATRRLRLPSIRLSDVQNHESRRWRPLKSENPPIRQINPSSPAFESFRALRTSLIFSNAVQSLRSIVVTSAAAGDGKSTVSSNLAAAFAQQGMRVVIVDCDLRRGRLHASFGVSRSPGLTELLVGSVTVEQAVRQTEIPGLFVLSAGKLPPNPSELLGSDGARAILTQLISEYDLVIMDTPPVLAATDAAVLSSIADGVVLVVRMGITDRRAARRSLDRLQIVGSRVLGTVLNDPQEILGISEDYYYYQYRYSTLPAA